MTVPDPLSLDTSSWSTSPRDRDGQKDDEAIYDGTYSPAGAADGQDQGQNDKRSIPERNRSIASVMNDDARAARRASRKQRPSRSRSLLDEIAADKAIKNRSTSQSSDLNAPQTPSIDGESSEARRGAKPGSLRRSGERRRFIQSPVDETEEDAETDAMSLSYTSIESVQSKRVSFEETDGTFLRNGPTAPISIPSRSPSNSPSLTSPRPILGVSTKSSAPERRMLRRTSARTSSSSWSPASAFLAQWNRDESAPIAEPDDEGQEIAGDSGYVIGRQIGYGGFSVVKEAHTIEHGEKVLRAVKIVRKPVSSSVEAANEEAQREFEHEIAVWRCLKHKRILPLISVYETSFATFCMMPMSSHGSLFDLVAKYRRQDSRHGTGTLARSSTINSISPSQPRKTIPLAHAKHYISQVASAIHYLHKDMRIVHRDIKLENCLLSTNESADHQSRHLKRSATTPTPAVEPFPGFPDHSDSALEESAPSDILLCDFGMADFIEKEDRDDRSSRLSLDADAASAGTKATGGEDGRPQNESDEASTPASANLGPGPNSAAFTNTLATENAATVSSPTPEADATSNRETKTSTDPTTQLLGGSLPYAAPELLHSSVPLYSAAADIWALGVLSYALLTGDLPFRHPLEGRVVQMIEEGAWDVTALKEAVRRSVQDAGQGGEEQVERGVELVEGCLRMDVGRRWSVGKVVRAEFLVGYEDVEV